MFPYENTTSLELLIPWIMQKKKKKQINISAIKTSLTGFTVKRDFSKSFSSEGFSKKDTNGFSNNSSSQGIKENRHY